jgi:hypothetical protein
MDNLQVYKGRSSQQDKECEIVKKFLHVARIGIQPNGILSLKPPYPDVLCKLVAGNNISFELTETVDPNIVRTTKLSNSIRIKMRLYFEKMTDSEKGRLQEIFGNASICFNLDDKTIKSSFGKLLPSIFHFLLSCTSDMNGNVDRRLLPNNVKGVLITRGQFNGPVFNTSNALYWADTTVERIRVKFQKQYKCDCPIELIVHSWTHSLPPDTLWLASVREFVVQQLDSSPFQRVWVFDYVGSAIRYVYPEKQINLGGSLT